MRRSTATAAWMGLGAGAAVLGVAGALLQRTLTVALEIRRYTEDIAGAGDAVAANTDVGGDLGRLRELVGEVRLASPRLLPDSRQGSTQPRAET